MKELLIIIRPKMYFPTKAALDEAGFYAMTIRETIGRGKTPVQYDIDSDEKPKHRLVAKKMIDIYVRDENVQQIIDIVLKVNESNSSGDGKIFVLPVENAIRVRTEEKGIEAIV